MEIEKETSGPNNTPAPVNSGGGAMGSGRRVRKDETHMADWQLWAFMPRCEPWQAVALSLNLEPPKYDHEVRGWPADYERRLKITHAYIEASRIPGSISTPRRSTPNSPCTVDLPLFGMWAQSQMWGLPDAFPLPLDVQANEHGAEVKPCYSTKWLEIQQAAIAQFFNPRRYPDAKKGEVIEWINTQAVSAGLGESNNIASTIFTIIKPENHDPKKKRVEPQQAQ